MDRLFMSIATGFGTGYLPKAPGTWGSLLALPLHFFLRRLAPNHYALALGAIFFIAVITAGQAEKILDRKDPGVIVIDEVIGMLITLIAAPDNPLIWLLGFALFRFFDIFKPYPIRLIDQRINGGLGIVLDDVLAGIYSLIVLQLFCYAIVG
ncbi:MAG: phosphatidylglycerophosphatase A [Desulfurivibrio sp.]|nr:phosphatidylglycerophosphatase A [Desulfurivibrio sp.]MBU3937585.1 phosphatidylglycerophosphatase A [Pseudomonadota bacterium]MBU4118568.1 phosphatidylglycerophosphatase A [Pseudomonadota bacterium]